MLRYEMNTTVKISVASQRFTGQQSMWHRSACRNERVVGGTF
jgi:hypothetical protein